MAAEPATPVKAPALADAPPESDALTAVAPRPAAKAPATPAKDETKKNKAWTGAEAAATGAGGGPSLAAHPRAVRSVARAKSWGGLFGFVFAGYVSLPTNTVAEAGVRAILAGLVCYVATWAGAVFVWRRLVILEIKAREQQLIVAARGPGDASAPPPGARGRAAGQ